MNQGIHTVDLLQWLLGPVARVAAKTRTALHAIEVEDTAVALLEFESGALATFEATTPRIPATSGASSSPAAKARVVLEHDRLVQADLRQPADDLLAECRRRHQPERQSPNRLGCPRPPAADRGFHRGRPFGPRADVQRPEGAQQRRLVARSTKRRSRAGGLRSMTNDRTDEGRMTKDTDEATSRMPAFICTTCGTQYADSERAAVGLQHLPGRAAVRRPRRPALDDARGCARGDAREPRRGAGPGIRSVETRPTSRIGQRALLLRHPDGNVLWDCVSLIDQETVGSHRGAWRRLGHRRLAPALLLVDGRVEPGVRRRADPPAQRRRAPGFCRPDPRMTFWAGDTYPIVRRPDAGPLRRALRRLDVLHWRGRRGRPRRAPDRRHREGRLGPAIGQRDAQLPESHSGWADRARSRGAGLAPLAYDDIYGAWTGHSIRGNAQGDRREFACTVSRRRLLNRDFQGPETTIPAEWRATPGRDVSQGDGQEPITWRGLHRRSNGAVPKPHPV